MADGEIEIVLAGKPYTLRCTPLAFKRVNALGGFSEAFRRIASFDADAYTTIIAAGLNKKAVEVEDLIYKTGIPNIVSEVSEFVSQLLNGGKPYKPEDDEGAGGGGEKKKE